MNREHIFTIAVSIDEDGIKKRALDACAEDIKKCVHQCFFDGYGGYRSGAVATGAMKEIMGKYVLDLLTKHEDEIVETVIDRITDKVYRSKSFKEKVKEVTG